MEWIKLLKIINKDLNPVSPELVMLLQRGKMLFKIQLVGILCRTAEVLVDLFDYFVCDHDAIFGGRFVTLFKQPEVG